MTDDEMSAMSEADDSFQGGVNLSGLEEAEISEAAEAAGEQNYLLSPTDTYHKSL